MIRTYTQLSKLDSFIDRYRYLRLNGAVGSSTFGYDRYINQLFYGSDEWKAIRRKVIIRDNGCDLGVDGYFLGAEDSRIPGELKVRDRIIIHHMNPIRLDDIEKRTEYLLDPEYLICVSYKTHQAIHYGDENQLILPPVERTKNDTCPWKNL